MMGMFIRPIYVRKNGKRHAYWALVKSERLECGPRQRVIAYLGQMDKRGRLAMKRAAEGSDSAQRELFDDDPPEWIEVDAKRVHTENSRAFGGPWLGRELMLQLGLIDFLNKAIPSGREDVPWPTMAMILVLSRLCEPSSELAIAEEHYEKSAMADLLGVPADKVNDDRLYRALDALLPHKAALEVHLKERLGELFALKYDLLLYDVTSTYFEGEAAANDLAAYGYSRDKRPDCKQICIALVVSRCGMPLGYEIFAGNTTDSTTVQQIVETIERRYGSADRIWVMDRGMVSRENVDFLRQSGRRYILGTPRPMLKAYQRQLVGGTWQAIREGLEVMLCPSSDGTETFILCRSADRREKEKAMHARFEKRIEAGLVKIEQSCRARRHKDTAIAERIGRLMQKNSRAASMFTWSVHDEGGRTILTWSKDEAKREWAALSEGCYLLRSNVPDWSAEELWNAYMQLTEAEAAFRIQKSDLEIRPIWHQKTERVEAHVLVCFLAYVLWKTLAQLCKRAGLGDEPRRVFSALCGITSTDVVLPTRDGRNVRMRCIERPDDHQVILLEHLGLRLPSRLPIHDM
jgi:hypothetical protein